MKVKMIQVYDLVKKMALWALKVALRGLKALVEETIIVLQALDTLLTKQV